jgi:hypothetical protein
LSGSERFERAMAAIDAANAEDPNRIVVRGRERPKELAHAELATEWLLRLVASPSEPLRLAVRAHHLRRWRSPRSDHPPGRPGYLRWRRALQAQHAEDVGRILEQAGYADELVTRVQAIVRKRGLGTDPEVQAFEDALCLVFVETQLADFAAEHPPEKAVEVLRKTLRKMSPEARTLALSLGVAAPARALLEQAAAQAAG